MRDDLPASLPLICVACRGTQAQALAVTHVVRHAGSEILDGILSCPRCGRRYPIIDGIPVLVRDTTAWLARHPLGLIDPGLSAEVAAVLVEPGPDELPLARHHELLSVHLDAHWGDHATPPVAHAAGLFDRLRDRSTARVTSAIELGSSFGRGLFELARGADLTIGIDHSLDALRRARRLLAGGELSHARRISGRHYVPASLRGEAAAARIELICADALELPLMPRRFARVVALNMLDAVADPPALLGTMVDLCEPGGEVICASPYAWQSGFVHDRRRIGTLDPGAEVVRMLTWERGLELEDQADVEWTLRRDDRNGSTHRVHWLRLRRPRS